MTGIMESVSQNAKNWEEYFDGLFSFHTYEVEKETRKNGIAIDYRVRDIYVWVNLNTARDKILNADFGRYTNKDQERRQTNFIKGVFINNTKEVPLEFLQTSFYGEHGIMYQANFNDAEKSAILRFLQIPFEQGWREIEYSLGKKDPYKVIVEATVNKKECKWTILLKSIAEQDIPFATDEIDGKITNFIRDSFINDFRRRKEVIQIPPLINDANKKYH